MAKRARGKHLLSAKEVQHAGEGDHNDGGGLVLRVRGDSSSWVFKFTSPATGKRREMGLGAAHRNSVQIAGASVANARTAAERAARLVADGKDPIDERDRVRDEAKEKSESARREKKAEQSTLARVARAYHEQYIEPEKSGKHAQQWINSLERHVPAEFWNAPIDSITAQRLHDFFVKVCRQLPETGSRIVQRLSRVFRHAEFHGMCQGNPAAAAAQKLRDEGIKHERGEFLYLSYEQVPAFVAELRKQPGTAARALEFTILTGARTAETLGAVWTEFDVTAATWTVPKQRMKGGEVHVVALSPRVLEILADMQMVGSPFVFPSVQNVRKPMSSMALLMTLRRMKVQHQTTTHGFRKSLSTWGNEVGFREDVVEAALAHREGDRVRRAYNKAQFHQERRALLCAWADYIDGKEAIPQNVVQLKAA